MMETFKTADLCDEFSDEIQVCQLEFRSFGKKKRFSGKIHTVHVHEDNVLVREALETVPAGSVVVVHGGGSKKCALLGDRLADIAVSRELSGIIINGCVRDSADLSNMDIGIFAIGTNPKKSVKRGEGKRDVPVYFGDVAWKPGDYVYADEDGVIVSSRPLF